MQEKNQTLNDIKIKNILSNLRQGDAVVLDIDDTLLRIASKKYGGLAPRLTESGLPGLLKNLKETGHPIILLTARSEKFHDNTIQQLSELGLVYDRLLHAPSRHTDKSEKTETKGYVLRDYLKELPEELQQQYRRLHVIDDNTKQLDAMKEALAQDKTLAKIRPIFYLYQPSTQMLERSDAYFPETLDDIHITNSLGGGTASTYQVINEAGKSFVLKHGASEDQVKIEILMNALYKALGVPIAEVQAYRAMPMALAKHMNLPHTALTVQLAEFIESKLEQDEGAIIKQICQDFVVHAFLGNIDVTKMGNLIHNQTGEIKLIDAGANFIFRALGDRRAEETTAVDELLSLRDPEQNSNGAQWFNNLSEDDIRAQVKRLVEQHRTIEKTIWDVSEQLEIPTSLKQQIINSFSHRLDQLAAQYGFASQSFAKADKVAVSGTTAAGVMHLERREGRLHVLLSKRVKHNWCDTFGGKSNDSDLTLASTARRECKEESGGVLLYSDKELSDASFHDLITEKANGQRKLYRMYFVEPPESLNIRELSGNEHTEYYWVALEDLQKAIEADQKVLEENRQTITVDGHIIYPPLYEMLKQAPVRTLIDALINDSPLVRRTQGVASTLPAQEPTSYRPMASVKTVTEQLIKTQLNKASMLSEIKTRARNQYFQPQADSSLVDADKTILLSPSELHLKTVMGDEFIDAESIATNVTRYLEKHSQLKLDGDSMARLIRQAVDMIEYERAHPDLVFFYHGLNGNIAFAYSVYTEMYRLLEADDSLCALRTDNLLFHSCLDIQTFIAHFQKLGDDEKVYNYDNGFMESALSVNPFIFGSHLIGGSNTIAFYITNTISSSIDMNGLFQVVFQSMGIDDALIERLVKLCLSSKERNIGRLYQLALPRDQVDTYAYAAAPGGRLKPLERNDQKTIALTNILDALRNNLIEDKQYIPTLQARVMVPPGAPISARSYYWSDNEPDAKLARQIKQLALDIVHEILRHRSQYNKLNSKSSLMRFLPEIMTEAGVGFGDGKITDALLIDLIAAADFESIKNIVMLYPEFKDKELISKKDGYGHKRWASKQKSSTLLQRLLKVAHSGETIRAIFGDTFYEGKLDTLVLSQVLAVLPIDQRMNIVRTAIRMILSINECCKILKLLPEAEQLAFAVECKGVIESGEQLVTVLKELPIDNRLAFATACMVTIKDGEHLATVLKELPEAHRHALATEFKGMIHNIYGLDIYGLAAVLNELPVDIRFDYAIKYRGAITDAKQLVTVLQQLPAAARLDYAIKCRGAITGAEQLVTVLQQLPTAAQLIFASECEEKIDNDDGLVAVLHELPEAERIVFATKLKGLIKYYHARVLHELPEANRLALATELKGVIESYVLAGVLHELPVTERLAFATELKGAIESDVLAGVLHELPVAERLAFATELKGVIKYHLANVLHELPEENRLAFTTELKGVIESGTQLAAVLHELPESERFAFATEFKDTIKHGYELVPVLKELPADHHLAFATEHKRTIKDSPQLAAVLQELPEAERLDFANELKVLIKDVYHLAIVLKELPEAARFGFATGINFMINNAVHLATALKELPGDKRLVFANEFKVTIKGGYELVVVLQELTEAERLAFATKHREAVKDRNHLIAVLKVLTEAERLTFAINFRRAIKSNEQLIAVLKILPDADRLAFATECKGVIEYGKQLSVVLKELPDEARLAFATECKGVIEYAEQLSVVLKELTEVERLAFINEYKGMISHSEELTIVLKELPDAERLAFANERKEMISYGEQLAAVLKELPEEARLAFATECKGVIEYGKQLSVVLKELPEEARLAFANELKGTIKYGDPLASVIEELPTAARLAFANECKGIIHDGYNLSDVLKELPAVNRLAFATECKGIIHDGYNLATVLKELPTTNRLAFATECKGIIHVGYKLAAVLKKLPAVNQLAFATECKGIIHDGYDLSAVLKKLPAVNQLAFATECEKVIENGYHLTYVIEELPAAVRLAFATGHINLFRSQYEITGVCKHLSEREQQALSDAFEEHQTMKAPPATKASSSKRQKIEPPIAELSIPQDPAEEQPPLWDYDLLNPLNHQNPSADAIPQEHIQGNSKFTFFGQSTPVAITDHAPTGQEDESDFNPELDFETWLNLC